MKNYRKHRMPKEEYTGENHYNNVLSLATVKQVKERLKEPGINVAALAREFGILRPTMQRIQEGTAWKYV